MTTSRQLVRRGAYSTISMSSSSSKSSSSIELRSDDQHVGAAPDNEVSPSTFSLVSLPLKYPWTVVGSHQKVSQ